MLDHVATRRLFLQRGLTLLSATVTVPTFLDHTVLALDAKADGARTQQDSGKDGKILVVIQLSGGNDGLNTVVPYADDAYHKARPAIRHDPKDVLKLNNYIGLHPNLASFNDLFQAGRMAVIQGVGYPNPNRSHFRSMDIWHTAQPDKEVATNGWLGRFFDNTCAGCDPHVGVSIGAQQPLAMKGDKITPLSFERPDSYRYTGKDRDRYEKLNKPAAPATQPAIADAKGKQKIEMTPANQLEFLTRTAMDAQVSSDDILRMTRGHNPRYQYPGNEFGQGLKTIAAMIKGGLATRVYYVSLGGFDTHAGERGRHDQLMNQLSQGVNAFMQDLAEQKNDDRVLVMTFSEFGRRVAQNASGGTDHGAAAPMFLFGKSVNQGIVGQHPSLTKLDQGDLIYTVDFRNIYATVLQKWLDTPSKSILGGQFAVMEKLLKV
jgi:uncharacterized protein (DUF1501 family)